MFKGQMNKTQLKTRDLFVKKFVEAGWDVGQWESLFKRGVDLVPEALVEYKNPVFDLRTGYYVADGYVSLECIGNEEPIAIKLRFYPQESLEEVVESIISIQNTLTTDNYTDFTRRMIITCDLVLFEMPDGSLLKLS
jgi:hypothetical protein